MTLQVSRVGGADPLFLNEVLSHLVLVSGLQSLKYGMTCTDEKNNNEMRRVSRA